MDLYLDHFCFFYNCTRPFLISPNVLEYLIDERGLGDKHGLERTYSLADLLFMLSILLY